MGIPLGGSPCPLFPDCIGIWSVGVFAGEENQSTGKRALGARTRTNNKLNPHHVIKLAYNLTYGIGGQSFSIPRGLTLEKNL